MATEREIIFEFLRLGGALKVTAVDVATGTEVSMVGDPACGEATLKRYATQKLAFVMNRKKA
jgi:hypothetical protein